MSNFENETSLRKKEEIEFVKSPINESDNLCGADLTNEDLSTIDAGVLLKCDFDTGTTWPSQDKLPAGFDPEKVMEEAKNPGLGIRELHRQGIDGRGVKVAIIDQTLSSEQGKYSEHAEYPNIIDYKEFGVDDEGVSMHGAAVASLFVGRTCGVAPGSELVYRAVASGKDDGGNREFNNYADALFDIIEFNKTLPPLDKIRIVSCSIGFMEDKPEPGLDRWIEAIKLAEEEGIVVSDVGDRTGVDNIGGGTSGDKDEVEGYRYALFLKGKTEEDDGLLKELMVKKDVDGILKRLREINKAEIVGVDDQTLRARIEKNLSRDPNQNKSIVVPSDYRTMASWIGPEDYMYNGVGGMSWAVPYLSGIFALVWQIRPDLKKEQIAEIINQTAITNSSDIKVINPKGVIEAVQAL